MITRCNHCGSKFEVSAELVFSTDPGVRCGECMSLFDARANLYDESSDRKTTASFKPVQRSRPMQNAAESLNAPGSNYLDSDYLETADTVATEHVYTSAGAKHIAESNTVGSTQAAGGNSYPDDETGNRPSNGFDDATANKPDHRPVYQPRYGVDDDYASDLEFERTVTTESSLPDRVDAPVADHVLDDQKHARRKQQDLREREVRALQMEPARDYKQSSDTASPYRDNTGRDRTDPRDSYSRRDPERARRRDPDRGPYRSDHRSDHYESRNNKTRVPATGRQSDIDSGRDTRLIPDDVVRRSGIVRDNGRRTQDATRFKPSTPDFDRSLNDDRAADRRPRADADDAARRGDARRAKEQIKDTLPDNQGGYRHGDRYKENTPNARPDLQHERSAVSETSAPETSAQEMRRYQQHRPTVETSSIQDDDILAERKPQTNIQPRSGIGTLFWMAGLVVAIGLLLFAARGFIAKMNLPEPVISSFCQVTGCVPPQIVKDVSQLQTMRKRLYPHPDIDDAMVISVDVINNSVFKQPLPTLAVSLMNAGSEVVAERNFDSVNYEVVDGSEPGLLMPGEPTRLKIEIIDTGLAATEVELAYE